MLKFFRFTATTPFIITCLILMMVLVVIGTLAQVEIGAFAAQKFYFNSFLVWKDLGGIKLPVFPGGLTIGLMWIISLISASIFRIRWTMFNLGLILSHLGIILLILGQGFTQIFSEEGSMAVEVGETSNYTEISSKTELVFIDVSDKKSDNVISIPEKLLFTGSHISNSTLPFDLKVKQLYRNSIIQPVKNQASAAATQGIGKGLLVSGIAPTYKDDETNTLSAIIEINDKNNNSGSWLVSTGIKEAQNIISGGKTYNIFLRPKRRYLPFSLTLKKFSHDIYPGTDIPKNFSSLVHVNYPEKNESRDVLIYMNHPLRFEGLTFYQSSFGKNDTLSIFQVVKNPAWLTPYISCIVVTLGLLIQFIGHIINKRLRSL